MEGFSSRIQEWTEPLSHRRIFCEILEFGDADPIEGLVHQQGKIVSAVLSVRNIPAIKKTLQPKANGLIIDLELTMFSLLLSELDGIPVAAHVRDATTARERPAEAAKEQTT